MSPAYQILINIFNTGLVNEAAMSAILMAAYQAKELKWSELKELKEIFSQC